MTVKSVFILQFKPRCIDIWCTRNGKCIKGYIMLLKSCRVCGRITNGTATCESHKPRRTHLLSRQARGYDREYEVNRQIVIDRAWRNHEHCVICGQSFASRDEITAEHIVPLRERGSGKLDNLGPAHARCNYAWNAAVTKRG